MQTYDDQAVEVVRDEEPIVEGVDAQPEDELAAAEAEVRADFGDPDEIRTDLDDAGPAADDSALEVKANEFGHLDPGGIIPRGLLNEALAFFRAHQAKFPNQKHISVLDYGLNSREPRFHVIDMATGAVKSLRMANGIGSEPVHNGQATRFGNEPGSKQSSLGPVRTAETYIGKNGRSLRLDGLAGSNSNMRKRAVVVHGANYVKDQRVVQGRSEGCPAVPMAQKDELIDTIKSGTFMFLGRSQ